MTVHFDLGGDFHCENCGRWIYAEGPALVIEQANGDDPPQACNYFNRLQESRTKSEQMRLADIAVRFEFYSVYGHLEPKREIRHLSGSTWEIKTAEDRILFYEVPATRDHKRAVRVTNCCEKSKSKTAEGTLPKKHIRKAQAIEKKDESNGAN